MDSTSLKYDVTLSVWNRFHSDEICDGLHRSGLKVYWIGNRSRPTNITSGHRDLFSVAWLYANRFLPSEICRQVSMTAFDWFAGLHPLNSSLLWAFAPMNTRLIAKANQQKIPVVLDVAIGHQRYYLKVMEEESRRLHLPFPKKLIEYWVRKYEWEYGHADWLSVGSNYVKKSLIKHGIQDDKILVNPYGIDSSRWRVCHEHRVLSENRMKFVYVAGISPRKGIHFLVEAWKKAKLKNSELVIVGGCRESIVKLCGMLPESISTPGRFTHDQLQELYKTADVYVLPSLLEGLARSGIEAMAAGLPLIITEETGLTDFVDPGKQGWVVPAKNVEALTDQLRWCHKHPEKVKEAGDAAFTIGQRQRFEDYGERCARICKAIMNDQDPRTALATIE